MTFTDRGQGYDVAIGGLPFKLAINGEQPYERATAQFRKEQFDSAPTVGDQSLTGWWTRGQLSFHKGAGVTYYEVIDGDTVIDRFKDSDSVDVFTPGKATLMPSLADMSVNAIDAVPAPLSRGGGVYVLTDTGVEYTAGSGTTPIDTSDSGVPTSITSSGERYYVVNGNLIERQGTAGETRTNHVTNPSFASVANWTGAGQVLSQTNFVTNPSIETATTGWSGSATAVRTNLIPNPSFETNTTGWSGYGATLTRGTSPVVNDGGHGRAEASGGTTFCGIQSAAISITGGSTYTASCYTVASAANSAATDTWISLEWSDGTTSAVNTGPSGVGITDRRSHTATAPVGATSVLVRLYARRTSAGLLNIPSGDVQRFDGIMLEETATLDTYFDGATTDAGGWDYAWTGTSHGSTSTATITSPSATLSSSAEQAKYGTKSLKVVNATAARFPAATSYTVSGLTDTEDYQALLWVYVPAQARSVRVKIGSTVIGTVSAEGSWEKFETTFTASGTTQAFTVEHTGSGDAAAFYVDGFLVTEDGYTGDYFDGDTADGSVTYAWTGSANASTSTASDTSTGQLTRSSTVAKSGIYSMKVEDEHGRPLPVTAEHALAGLTNGVEYRFIVWVYVPTQDRTVSVAVDGAGALATSSTYGAWEKLTGSFTATGTDHDLQVTHSGSGDAAPFYVDSVLWTESPYFGDYFDGSYPGATWSGAQWVSKSTRVVSDDGSSVALWTNTDADWSKVWWAKGRLWATDAEGFWYALAPTGGTAAQVDAFWNSGNATAPWSLTEGTGPVYISDGYDIYTVTVATDGVVPTLTSPTTAARMPLGEQIANLTYYLGSLVIPTSRGVRTALTQDDQVLLGPLVVKGDFTASNRVGAFDTKAYVVGRLDGRDGAAVLCVLDLSQQVSDLVPAYSPLATVSTLTSVADGAVLGASGRIYTWSAESLLVSSADEVAAEGYVTTGFHRFGTLEPKHFRSVLVRLGGTGGSVEVSRVDADGSETLLETITLPVTGAVDVPLGMTSPAEMIGLKFALSRDADITVGPELLGYQLRALPAPQRQRMIRMPLSLVDVERRGGAPASGYAGSAWDRLLALETMEADNAIVTYKDYRTGEESDVAVESVEHRGVTPPGPKSTGFGGVVWVTMRKV